jgi:hypothetical protein
MTSGSRCCTIERGWRSWRKDYESMVDFIFKSFKSNPLYLIISNEGYAEMGTVKKSSIENTIYTIFLSETNKVCGLWNC